MTPLSVANQNTELTAGNQEDDHEEAETQPKRGPANLRVPRRDGAARFRRADILRDGQPAFTITELGHMVLEQTRTDEDE